MSLFSQLFKGTFLENEQQKEEKTLILREAIKPTETFKQEYADWLAKDFHKGLLDYLKECTENRLKNPQSNTNLYLHQSKHSNGFYFRAESPWEAVDYRFLVYHFVQKLKKISYVESHAIREANEEKGQLTTVEEYFLKPSLKFRKSTPYKQFFGNIFIEHQLKNDQTSLVKVMANTYTDQHFEKAYDFEDLIHELCLI